MFNNDVIFNKIAEALLIDYSSVYYVNAETNEYQWYSINEGFHSLSLEESGKDFFKDLVRDADRVIYEEDKHLFMKDMTKEKLLAEMSSGSMQSIEYRLMIDGKPVWHTLRLIREAGKGKDNDYFILGVINIDKKKRNEEEQQKIQVEREIFNQIAGSLAEHYDTLYYVDMEENRYFEFSSTNTYKRLNIPVKGADFFKESAKNIKKYVHPDDVQKVLDAHVKANIINNLKNTNTFSFTYRLKIGNDIMNCRNSQIWASDKKHIIICIENIDAEIIAERVFVENQKNSMTYSQIAESLASRYDTIFYVDIADESFLKCAYNNTFGNLEIQERGDNFFTEINKNTNHAVHKEDRDRILSVLNKDYLLSALDKSKHYSTDYRLIVDKKPQFTRLTVTWSSDRIHFVIGIENINDEILKEEEHTKALQIANELARRDELTGAKNKNAYRELEQALQLSIDNSEERPAFAIVVCDLNNLKHINDTLGHKIGDEYIQASCKLIFDTFSHSPVFRIGGDEFVAVLTERDYTNKDKLFSQLKKLVLDNNRTGKGPIIASGMSVFDSSTDSKVSDVFERADTMMYKNKKELKGSREG